MFVTRGAAGGLGWTCKEPPKEGRANPGKAGSLHLADCGCPSPGPFPRSPRWLSLGGFLAKEMSGSAHLGKPSGLRVEKVASGERPDREASPLIWPGMRGPSFGVLTPAVPIGSPHLNYSLEGRAPGGEHGLGPECLGSNPSSVLTGNPLPLPVLPSVKWGAQPCCPRGLS